MSRASYVDAERIRSGGRGAWRGWGPVHDGVVFFHSGAVRGVNPTEHR